MTRVPFPRHASFWERPDHFNDLLTAFLLDSVGWVL
jgi:hypothetical protein